MLCVQPVTHHKPKKVDYEGLCNVVVFGSGWKLNLCELPCGELCNARCTYAAQACFIIYGSVNCTMCGKGIQCMGRRQALHAYVHIQKT